MTVVVFLRRTGPGIFGRAISAMLLSIVVLTNTHNILRADKIDEVNNERRVAASTPTNNQTGGPTQFGKSPEMALQGLQTSSENFDLAAARLSHVLDKINESNRAAAKNTDLGGQRPATAIKPGGSTGVAKIDGDLSKGDHIKSNLIDAARNTLDTLADVPMEKQMRLQTYMETFNQTSQMLSNILDKVGKTSEAVTQNMKGGDQSADAAGSGSELSMINLQTLVAQREQAVSLARSVLQKLAEQQESVVKNLGGGPGAPSSSGESAAADRTTDEVARKLAAALDTANLQYRAGDLEAAVDRAREFARDRVKQLGAGTPADSGIANGSAPQSQLDRMSIEDLMFMIMSMASSDEQKDLKEKIGELKAAQKQTKAAAEYLSIAAAGAVTALATLPPCKACGSPGATKFSTAARPPCEWCEIAAIAKLSNRRVADGDGAVSGELFAFMLAYQKLVNIEARMDQKLTERENEKQFVASSMQAMADKSDDAAKNTKAHLEQIRNAASSGARGNDTALMWAVLASNRNADRRENQKIRDAKNDAIDRYDSAISGAQSSMALGIVSATRDDDRAARPNPCSGLADRTSGNLSSPWWVSAAVGSWHMPTRLELDEAKYAKQKKWLEGLIKASQKRLAGLQDAIKDLQDQIADKEAAVALAAVKCAAAVKAAQAAQQAQQASSGGVFGFVGAVVGGIATALGGPAFSAFLSSITTGPVGQIVQGILWANIDVVKQFPDCLEVVNIQADIEGLKHEIAEDNAALAAEAAKLRSLLEAINRANQEWAEELARANEQARKDLMPAYLVTSPADLVPRNSATALARLLAEDPCHDYQASQPGGSGSMFGVLQHAAMGDRDVALDTVWQNQRRLGEKLNGGGGFFQAMQDPQQVSNGKPPGSGGMNQANQDLTSPQPAARKSSTPASPNLPNVKSTGSGGFNTSKSDPSKAMNAVKAGTTANPCGTAANPCNKPASIIGPGLLEADSGIARQGPSMMGSPIAPPSVLRSGGSSR